MGFSIHGARRRVFGEKHFYGGCNGNYARSEQVQEDIDQKETG
jgi:hypothetical protein